MKAIFNTLIIFLYFTFTITAQETTYTIPSNFNKIIISPHIEVTFKKGDKASIRIDEIFVPTEKLQYELKKGTLQVFLEGAKTITTNTTKKHNGWKQKTPIYKNKIAKVTITYNHNVNTFSVRGEEKIEFTSPIKQNDFTLRIYGKSEVNITNIELNNLKVAIYGDSDLNIENGTIANQRITAYGSSTVNCKTVKSKNTKLTAYGDGTYQLNITNQFKVTAYGEANIIYTGNASVKKGLIIGDSNITKI